MSDNNKIFDDNYRENFIRSADPIALNDYLKNMERLSRKGGKYLDMYNKDLIYLLDLNDTVYQDGGNLGTLFSQASERPISNTEQYNTEAYLGKIHNITQHVKPKPSELETLKDILIIDLPYDNNKKKALYRFIDIIMTNNNDIFISNEYSQEKIKYLKDLSKLISNNNEYMQESFLYLTKLLQNKEIKNKLSEVFMKEYIEIRQKKNNIQRNDYKLLKDKFISGYINKLGQDKIYASKFVEKIINSYKKQQAKIN